MTLTDPVSDRLLKSSARHSYDPVVDIDWEAPLVDGLWFMQPERMSLYGTPTWDALSEEQRIELSRHEVASQASVGLWFELILMQVMLRDLYDEDPTFAADALRAHGDRRRVPALAHVRQDDRPRRRTGVRPGPSHPPDGPAACGCSAPASVPMRRSSSPRRSSTAGSAR